MIMNHWSMAILLLTSQLLNAVTITPDTTDPFVKVELLSPDNKIENNEWDLVRPINAWGISLRFDAEKYSFQPGLADSTISITMDLECTGECDLFYAFSFGDKRYSTFMHNYDGGLYGNPGSKEKGGIFTYPACKASSNNPLLTGDPSELLNDANDDWDKLRLVMGSGKDTDLLSATLVKRNVPVTFEFINNDIDDTFTIKFTQSGSYPNGIECVYQGAAPKCLDFIWYQTPDAGDTASKDSPQRIKSFEISSVNTGRTEACNEAGTESGAQCVVNQEISGKHWIVIGNQNWKSVSSGNKPDECADDTSTTGVGSNSYGNEIGVQCCKQDGKSGHREGCLQGVTYDEAKAHCEGKGDRLCTAQEVTNHIGGSTGCFHNARHVWTSTECGDPNVIPGVELDEFESVEFTLDKSFTNYQSNAEHTASIYFNGKIYECNFTPNGADQFSCALDCGSSNIPCSTMTLIGNDCKDDHSIKLAISNPSADYAVFTSFKVVTTTTYYGAQSFCGTGLPYNFEIDGTLYADFIIKATSNPPICGIGLYSNYKNVCVGNGAECVPSTLVIEFDSNTPNQDIQYALIEDGSNLNKEAATCCNIDGVCCDDSQCCSGSICGDNGKCEEIPTTVIDDCRESPSSTEKPAKVWGDPHYISYSGKKFDFQGAGCYYYMTQCPTTPGDNGRKLTFNVRAMHWQCNSRAKCIEKVFVDIIGTDNTIIDTIDIRDSSPTQDIEIDINSNGLNGKYRLSKLDNKKSRVFELNTNAGDGDSCGPDLKFTAKFVAYKSGEYVNLYVYDSKCFKCDTCGLLSIYSPTSTGEYLLGGPDKKTVELTRQINEFGYSWYYGDNCLNGPGPPGTTEEFIDVEEECKNKKLFDQVTEKCAALFAEFDECCSSDPEFDGCDEITDSCVYDTCAALIDDDTLTPQQAVDLFARPDLEFICETPEAPSDNPTSSPITYEPTRAPTVQKCNNDLSYNYVFLFDESKSVKEPDYVSSIEFVEKIINEKINDISKFAALGFGHSNDLIYSFIHQQFDNKQGINNALEQEKEDWNNQLGTDTKNAMIAGVEEFENSGFKENNVLVLVTDGKPACIDDPNCSKNICGDQVLLDRIKASNIRVLILGITSGFDEDQLKCLVENENTDIFVVADYSPQSLNAAFIQFESVICPPKSCQCKCDEKPIPITQNAKQVPFNYYNNNNNNNNEIQMEMEMEKELEMELSEEIKSLQFKLETMHYTLALIIFVNLSFCICACLTKLIHTKQQKMYSFIPQKVVDIENNQSDVDDDDDDALI